MTEMTEGSVLDLPEERQRELAAMFKLSLEDWRTKMIEAGKRADEVRARLDANAVDFDDLTPEEQAREIAWGERLDSENIITAEKGFIAR